MTAKQRQYSAYVANGGKMNLEEWEKDGRYDPYGNYILAKDLQIGNYVTLVYDKETPRKVEAIYDNSVSLEGREEPDDERDLVPIPAIREMLQEFGLKKEDYDYKLGGVLRLPYVHLLQQLVNLVNQSKLYADR